MHAHIYAMQIARGQIVMSKRKSKMPKMPKGNS